MLPQDNLKSVVDLVTGPSITGLDRPSITGLYILVQISLTLATPWHLISSGNRWHPVFFFSFLLV